MAVINSEILIEKIYKTIGGFTLCRLNMNITFLCSYFRSEKSSKLIAILDGTENKIELEKYLEQYKNDYKKLKDGKVEATELSGDCWDGMHVCNGCYSDIIEDILYTFIKRHLKSPKPLGTNFSFNYIILKISDFKFIKYKTINNYI